jgi:predicted nuclease with TOPRIM domain
MDVRELKATYTMRDMAKIMRRIDELIRENNAFRKQLTETKEQLETAQCENADLTAQLYDLQGDFARQMTSACVLPLNREQQC